MLARWFNPRALLLHLAVLIWSPGCVIAGIWQVNVALSGLRLAWVYSIEWPVFAVFGLFVWYHLIVDDPETVGARGLRRARQAAGIAEPSEARPSPVVRRPEAEDERLAAYNDYLAALAANDRRKSLRHP
ncbi:MAG: hypothetical protein ACRDY2_10715 [Acidimicrobiales bacterium]